MDVKDDKPICLGRRLAGTVAVRLPGPWLVLLTSLATLGGSADAQSHAQDPSDRSSCGHIDAEVAFVQGLDAFLGETSERTGDRERAEAYFARAAHCDAEYGNALYWLGVTHLLQGKPAGAVVEISRSLEAKEAPSAERWRVLAHLGTAHLKVGDERAAGRSLEAARRMLAKLPHDGGERDWDDRDVVAIFLLGKSLQQLGRGEAGEKLIARARDLRADIEASGEAIAPPRYRGSFWPPKGPWRWEGRLGLSVGTDSNPNQLDDELTLSTLDGKPVHGADSDYVQALDVRLALYRLLYRLDDDRAGNWSLGLAFQGHQSRRQEFGFLDLGQGRAVIHLAWGTDPLSYADGPLGYTWVPYGHGRVSLLFQGGYRYAQLDGARYSRGAEAALSITLRQTRFMDTRVELTYQDSDYADAPSEDRDQSGYLRTVDLSQFLYLGRRNRYMRLGLAAGERQAGRAYARSHIEPYVEAALPITSKWSVLVTGSVRDEDFDYLESNLFLPESASEPRQDTTVSATASLAWSFRPRQRLFISLSFVDRDAELELPPAIPGLDYERTRAWLGFKWFLGSGG